MTHPGLAVMFVVGVGLGAVLYYFFASTPEQVGQNNRRQQRTNHRSDSNRTYWTSQSSDPRNRRQDQKCMICLEDSNKDSGVRLVPCLHVFHKLCIEEWRVNGVRESRQSCPNCRDKIQDLEEL